MAPKRKRASTLPSKNGPEGIQPSSHDDSGEDTTEPVLEDVKEQKSLDPPSKRTRSSRAPTFDFNGAGPGATAVSGAAASSANGTVHEAGAQGEAGKMRMEPPPKAGLIDPEGGYKTNKPPEGRSVRVYADGVFDLFHLGYNPLSKDFVGNDLILTICTATCASSSKPKPPFPTPISS
jgi:choline-phosphate cytidylyltransferase